MPLRTSRAPAPTYVEYLFSYLIGRTDTGLVTPAERLEALERSLDDLTRRWRPAGGPLVPARSLRMSDGTMHRVVDWVETNAPASGSVLERLAVYLSGAVVDPAVPDGWLRVRVATPRPTLAR